MGRFLLLVLFQVLTLSYVIQTGESQIDGGVTIAEKVTEALRPDIAQIREDVMRNLAELSHKLGNLTEQVVNLTERLDQIENLREQGNNITERVDKLTECVEQQKHEWGHRFGGLQDYVNDLQFELLSVKSSVNDSLQYMASHLTSKVESKLAMMDSAMRDGFKNITVDFNVKDHRVVVEKLTYIEKNLTQHLGFTCGGTGGWRRVVFLNVAKPKTFRRPFRASITCGSAFYPVSGGPYNQVCGMIRAYQWGEPHYAFRGLEYSIDDPYFTGVAVMHGNPRKHIWTFTTGKWENDTNSKVVCPCDTVHDIAVPDFVGKDYFCESGYIYPGYYNQTELSRFHSEDVLWDGKDCHTTSKCCSLNSPPYFTKLLSQTSDDIEVRTCRNYGGHIQLEHVELYVKQDYNQEKQEKTDRLLKKAIQHQVNNLHVHQCGGTGGWRRAMYLDMTDPLTECPDGWQLTGFSKRTCSTSRNYRSCDSTFLPVGGGPYNQVCGRIRAYQFGMGYGLFDGRLQIDNAYFDGVAVMHGIPRNHIWTFVAGRWENAWRIEHLSNYFNCPCDSGKRSPAFVGDDYFCESGYVHPGYRNYSIEKRFNYNDTLWDGQDCLSTSTCCSRNNPPYFTKNLSRVTTDDLELRICKTVYSSNTAVEFVEMYVKLNPAIDLTADNIITESLPQPVYYDSSIHVHTCGGTGGWRRAVFLDMTDPNTDCPDGWELSDYSKRTCYQHRPTYYANCSSAFFPVSGGAYHHVCGRIRAYQHWRASGFYLSFPEITIDDPYFDGLAVMHGQRPRHHIWTFAVGAEENNPNSNWGHVCPCDGGSDHPPPFVGEDYFCESGYIYPGYRDRQREFQLHYNDTLWDGEDCHESSTCCSLNNPPYFTKTLSKITDDDLEVRACLFNTYPVAIELVELYVKL